MAQLPFAAPHATIATVTCARFRFSPVAFMNMTCLTLLALTSALTPGQPAPPCDTYYLLVFGMQKPVINNPNYTHSFATFVRIPGGPTPCGIESFTISWMPRNLAVRAHALLPEPGINLDLHTSLRWGVENCLRISMWGPFQIRRELYEIARQQLDHLTSGEVSYKATDIGFPSESVSNCIHAVTDVTFPGPRLRIAIPGWGQSASYFIALSMEPWIVEPTRTHDWLFEPLGLCGYELVRRDLDSNPTRGPILRVTQSMLRLGLSMRRP